MNKWVLDNHSLLSTTEVGDDFYSHLTDMKQMHEEVENVGHSHLVVGGELKFCSLTPSQIPRP